MLSLSRHKPTDARHHFRTPLLKTHFHDRTSEANRLNDWVAWGGYTTSNSYEDVTAEYTAIRNQASLYDLCPMVKYAISGPDAEAFTNRLTLRDTGKLKVGSIQYTAWCDDDGKVMDDGTLWRFSPSEYRLCCQERHLPWLLDSALGYDVKVSEISEEIAALSLQGPCAYAVLKRAGYEGAKSLKPFAMAEFPLARGALTISRTGFTGDLGYELWTTPDLALMLWNRLMEAGSLHGLRPIGSAALNMARIEAGFIIANIDFIAAEQALRADRRRSPFELGLGWMVDFKKGHFNGRRVLLKEQETGSSRYALVGLDIDGNVPADHSLVYHGKRREVGQVTSALWSPAAKRNIALALLERPYHEAKADDLWVEIYAMRELAYHKLMVKARVAPRPFFAPARRKQTPPAEW